MFKIPLRYLPRTAFFLRCFFPLALSFFALTLSGCIQSSEQLVVNEDGSGILRVHQFIPQGTVELVDTLLGKMMQAPAEALLPEAPPASLAEQMFANKAELQKVADEAGLKADIVQFSKDKTLQGLTVNYEVVFDDAVKLAASHLIGSRLLIARDEKGNWVCGPRPLSAEAEQSKAQIRQFGNFQESEQFKSLDADTQKNILFALSQLKIDLSIAMPYDIEEIHGVFQQVDKRTAKFEFAGDILKDESLLEKINGFIDEPSRIVWAKATESKVPEISEAKEMGQQAPDLLAKIILKDGKVIRAKIIERTPQHIKVEAFGVLITYYPDEIEKIE